MQKRFRTPIADDSGWQHWAEVFALRVHAVCCPGSEAQAADFTQSMQDTGHIVHRMGANLVAYYAGG